MAAATADHVIARRRRPARRQWLVIMKAARDATAAIVAVAPASSSLVLGVRMLAVRAAGLVTDEGRAKWMSQGEVWTKSVARLWVYISR